MKTLQPTLEPQLVFHKVYCGKDMFSYLTPQENTPEILAVQAKFDYTPIGLKYDAFAWPGGYPIFYLTADNGILCPKCANENISECACPAESREADPQWRIVAADINYEDDSLYCDHCNKQIETAYGE